MAIGYDQPITFGRVGTARTLKSSGIDFTEDGERSWTYESTAQLEIPLPLFRKDILLKIEGSPFVATNFIRAQQVFVFVNSLFAGFCSFEAFTMNVFPLARTLSSERETLLTLVIPTAISPKKLGIGDDMRHLGIYLSSIEFSTRE